VRSPPRVLVGIPSVLRGSPEPRRSPPRVLEIPEIPRSPPRVLVGIPSVLRGSPEPYGRTNSRRGPSLEETGIEISWNAVKRMRPLFTTVRAHTRRSPQLKLSATDTRQPKHWCADWPSWPSHRPRYLCRRRICRRIQDRVLKCLGSLARNLAELAHPVGAEGEQDV